MLNKKGIEALAGIAGLKVEDLTKAINDEKEVDVEVLAVRSFTKDEWETFEARVDSEKKERYDSGKEVGANQQVKYLKEKIGLEYDGKDPDLFVQKFEAKVLEDAEKSPDGKVKQLQDDINSFKSQLDESQNENNSLKTQIRQFDIDSKIDRFLPDAFKDGWSKDDARIVAKNTLSFDYDENGNEIVKNKSGEIMKNEKTREPFSFEQAILELNTQKSWGKKAPGSGGGDDDPVPGGNSYTTAKNMTELNKYFDENNINPLGEEARGIINEVSKENTEFDFSS